jgi:hypothetical protein
MSSIPFIPSPVSNFGRASVYTPSDTQGQNANALYVGVTGDITCIPAGQTTAVLFKAVPVGFFPVAVSQVMATGTTAGSLLGL